MNKTARYLPILLASLAGCAPSGTKNTGSDGIPEATMAETGIDSTLLNKVDTAVQHGTYPNIHSLLIARHNKLVYEKYWPGKDESWGRDLGIVPHGRDSLHDIRSVTKSIVSACIGIALQQGKIKSVDQKVFDFFPEYARLDTGMKSALTIGHLLSMTSGLKWNEEVPYDNPENSEIQMMRSPQPLEFVLSQPMEFPVGQVWKYNGGTTQLLAAIIEKTTGKRVDQFAKEYLFQPLGITRFEWVMYPGTGLPAAASGLRLRSRDMMKFGLMYQQNGVWEGKQIVPAQWIATSFEPHAQQKWGGEYGYQFWIIKDTVADKPGRVPVAIGNGDQAIAFDKARDMVIVVTAGNYNKWNLPRSSKDLVKDYVHPAVK